MEENLNAHEIDVASNTNNNQFNVPIQQDKVSVGFCILAWFCPLFALIYFLTKKTEKPKCAKAVGIVGLVSIIVYFFAIVVSFAFTGSVFKTVFNNVDFSDSSVIEETQEGNSWNDFEFSYDNNENDKSENSFDDNAARIDDDTVNAYDNTVGFDETARRLGGARQGYIVGLEGTWFDFRDDEVQSENMVQYSNSNEIITMFYYDATGYSKEDIRNSVSASLDNIIANRTDVVINEKRHFYLYPDFYGESVYTKNSEGYQLFTLLFQSDKASDMIYLAIESPFMSDNEFESFVNQVINCHSFIPYQLNSDYSFTKE